MVDVAAQDDFVAGFLAGQGRVCSLSAHRLSLALPLAVRGLTRCSLCVWLHQAQQDAALSAARRELPTPARSWGVDPMTPRLTDAAIFLQRGKTGG